MNFPVNINLNELSICINLLHKIFGNAEVIFEWLNYPHPLLGNRRPRDLIVENKISAVIKVLENMVDGDTS